jgi:uncharacterized protein (TIGR02594 family)
MNDLPTIPWIQELDKVLGWHETNDREKLAKWLRSDGATLGDPSKLPWCGDAMDTAISRCLPDEPRPGDLGKNPYWALNWDYFGVKCPPLYGAIGVFKRTSGGHVGVLIGANQNQYRVYGGNQSDAVTKDAWINKTQLVSARWPVTFRNPRKSLPLFTLSKKPASDGDLG